MVNSIKQNFRAFLFLLCLNSYAQEIPLGSKIVGNGDSANYYIGHFPVAGSDGLDLHWYGGIRFGDWKSKSVMQITDGNVGINTVVPETLLNINVGAGGSNGIAGIRVGGLNNYSSLEFGIDGDYDGMIRSYGNNINYYAGHWKTKGVAASENHSHNWYTSKEGSSDWSWIKMTLNQDGNLGIGIIDPTNKLDVNGTIHSKEVKVDMKGWSDFVFKKEYNLPTLEDVEKHIDEKGHLENIPSEEEVLKNGISLGEMNSKLLQKIEELTLYSIEQNKKIETLEKKVEAILKNKP